MKLRWMKGFLVTGMVLALSACAANNRYCLGNQPYDDAVSVPILHPADGLQMPHVAGAFVVPPPVKDGVPFGKQTKGADGKSTIACLDQPPAIPAPQGDSISVPTRHD